MWRLVLAAVLAVSVAAGSCAVTQGAGSESALTTRTSVTQEPPSSTTRPADTADAADLTTVTDGVPAVAVCEDPRPLMESDSEAYARLHGAVSDVVTGTNRLGGSLLAVRDFSSDWRDDPAVSGIVNDLLDDVEAVEVVAAEILDSDLGAVYDPEGVMWVFPDAIQPLTPSHGNLEELAMASQVFEDVILSSLFSMPSLDEAVMHWNVGGSPCGHAQGLVERLHGTHALFVPYRIAHDEVFVGTRIGMNVREIGDYDELRFAGVSWESVTGEAILFRRWNADGYHEDLVLVRRSDGTVTDGLTLSGNTTDVWLGVACEGQSPVILATTDGDVLRSWSVGEGWKLHETTILEITEDEARSACATDSAVGSED